MANPIKKMTPREYEVLELIAHGYNNSAIGKKLIIEKRTVERHITAIFEKLDLAYVQGSGVHPRVVAANIFRNYQLDVNHDQCYPPLNLEFGGYQYVRVND